MHSASMVSVIHSLLQPKNIKWKNPEIMIHEFQMAHHSESHGETFLPLTHFCPLLAPLLLVSSQLVVVSLSTFVAMLSQYFCESNFIIGNYANEQ